MTTKANEKLTEIIEQLTEIATSTGTLPWARPWSDVGISSARSASTGKAYRGINRWILGIIGETEYPGVPNVWATYKQIAAEGGQVRKGQKSQTAILWKILKVEDKANAGKLKTVPMLRTFNVFHWTQADWPEGTEPKVVAKVLANARLKEDIDSSSEADAVVQAYFDGGGPVVSFGGDSAFYTPHTDGVQLPVAGAFHSTEAFYSTLFHELGHSTGHKSRLNRDLLNGFGTELYSREELVAEMTSALLLSEVGLDSDAQLKSNGAYLKSWLKALENDPMALSWAATRAEKAHDHILGIEAVSYEEEAA